MSRKVFVINSAHHDYTTAHQFGRIVPITEGYVRKEPVERLIPIVAGALKNSSPEDFFLPSGLFILNVLAAAVWVTMHDSINLLVWDSRRRAYRPLQLESDQLTWRDLTDASEEEEVLRQG